MAYTFTDLYTIAAASAFDKKYKRFPEDKYKLWINWGQEYLAKHLPLDLIKDLSSDWTVGLTLGVHRQTTPTDFLRPESVLYNNNPCDIVDENYWKLQRVNAFCQSSASKPYIYFRGRAFELFPAPVGGDVLVIKGVKVPPHGEVSIPQEFAPLVIKYAVYMKHYFEGDERHKSDIADINGSIALLKGQPR